jgi:hypothetical protein
MSIESVRSLTPPLVFNKIPRSGAFNKKAYNRLIPRSGAAGNFKTAGYRLP